MNPSLLMTIGAALLAGILAGVIVVSVYAARQLLMGGLKAGQPFQAGRLGSFTPHEDAISMQVALPVMVFTRDNVDQFHF